jgi:hypothetical protein
MLLNTNLPHKYWGEAAVPAAYITNKCDNHDVEVDAPERLALLRMQMYICFRPKGVQIGIVRDVSV